MTATLPPAAGARAVRRFRLGRRGRRVAVIAHLVSSLGWFGLDLVLLTLGSAAAADPGSRHVRYLALQLLLDTLLLPLGLLSTLTGLVLVYGGRWGLLRHRWVAVKLLIGVASLIAAWFALRPRADWAVAATTRPGSGSGGQLFATLYGPGWTLVIAPAVALILNLIATVLGVVKPGRRR